MIGIIASVALSALSSSLSNTSAKKAERARRRAVDKLFNRKSDAISADQYAQDLELLEAKASEGIRRAVELRANKREISSQNVAVAQSGASEEQKARINARADAKLDELARQYQVNDLAQERALVRQRAAQQQDLANSYTAALENIPETQSNSRALQDGATAGLINVASGAIANSIANNQINNAAQASLNEQRAINATSNPNTRANT